MENLLKIYFFNQAPYTRYYGSGECTYIELPDEKKILIDIASKESAKIITKKLFEMNVRKIDYLVVSHLHVDHTDGFAELISSISVKQVIVSGYGFQSVDADIDFLNLLNEKNIPMMYVRMGDELSFGNVRLQFLFPPKDIKEVSTDQPYEEQEKNSNIYSLVFKITYGKFYALFAGDIYKEAEEQLVQIYGNKLRSTLYKIPHHGNDTSDPLFALEWVKPQVAITMQTDGCGLNVYCEKGYRKYELI